MEIPEQALKNLDTKYLELKAERDSYLKTLQQIANNFDPRKMVCRDCGDLEGQNLSKIAKSAIEGKK